MKQKHIAIFKKNLDNKGGLEKQTLFILKALLNKNYKISIITNSKKTFFHPNLFWYAKKEKSFFNFLNIFNFNKTCKKWLKKNKCDIAFSMERTTDQTHIRAGNGVHKEYIKAIKKKFFFLNPKNLISLQIEKKAFENPNLKKIITNSYLVKSQILKYYKVKKEIIEVIHNGVAWDETQKDFSTWMTKKDEIIKSLKIPFSNFYFLFVGNGFKRKGLESLLKASYFLKEKDFHLLIVGKDKNIKKYINYSKKLQLDKKVSFFGSRSDIKNFYQISDCLVIPSYYDPFSNVLVEALAMGVNVISSKEDGGSEIISTNNLEKLGCKIIQNPDNSYEIKEYLEKALNFPKTKKSSIRLRDKVKYLEVSNQMKKIIDAII
ncbi:MAG: hypothetical protein AMS24_00890 [Chlamydiae bacterium SM23_39]|nr:MAG: hypothetical protein AMS24_00890 [Chlamydiae bacterium SM23_39]